MSFILCLEPKVDVNMFEGLEVTRETLKERTAKLDFKYVYILYRSGRGCKKVTLIVLKYYKIKAMHTVVNFDYKH